MASSRISTLDGQLRRAFNWLVATVIAVIASVVIVQQYREGLASAEQRATTAREELRKKGQTVTRTIVLASERAIGVMDYLFLTEIVDVTTQHDDQLLYVMFMDRDGRALVHSDKLIAGTVLDGPDDVSAGKLDAMTDREIVVKGKPAIEFIAPMVVAGQRWGTLRLALSLQPVLAQIQEIRGEAQSRLRQGIIAAVVIALVLLVVAMVIARHVAQRISQPLGFLLEGVNQLRRGVLDQTVRPNGAAEFRELAGAFNDMTASVRERDEALRTAVTTTEQALHRAQEANRLKSEFLANVSHELRTPLNAIVNIPKALARDFEEVNVLACASCKARFETDGSGGDAACPQCGGALEADLAVRFNGDTKEHHHFLGRVQKAGHHLLDVVNNILDFSKLEAGRMQLTLGPCTVDTIVGEVCATAEILAEQKHIELTHEASEKRLDLRADKVKLSQIVLNLVGNSIKFTPDGGHVSVRTSLEMSEGAPWARICVTDDGIGIPADKLEVVFESFQQVDGSHTRSHGGTGLGLAIVRQMVTMHGGRVWAESTLGRGSSFIVMLPMTETRESTDQQQQGAAQ